MMPTCVRMNVSVMRVDFVDTVLRIGGVSRNAITWIGYIWNGDKGRGVVLRGHDWYAGSCRTDGVRHKKDAIQNFRGGLAQLLAEKGTRANGVAPGPTWTPLIPSTMKPSRSRTSARKCR
jgi:hypothetical protein